jgi:hypothetical protein
MNFYSYVEYNRLRFTDPSGREIYEAAKIAGGTLGFGAHEFFYIAPEHPENVHIDTLPPNTSAFTIGGFPTGPWWNPGDLVVQYGYSGKQGINSDYEAAVYGPIRGTPVKIDFKKAGYKTEAELINAMGSAANSASGGNAYGFLGKSWGAIWHAVM